MELKIIPVVQVFISAIVMMLVSNFLPNLTVEVPAKMFIVELLIFIGIFCGVLAVTSFRRHQTTVNPSTPEKTSSIVDSGIYSFSRNPMYLAMLIGLIALALYFSNIAAACVIPCFIIYITRFQIIPEERALNELFGDEFVLYSKKVRRWL